MNTKNFELILFDLGNTIFYIDFDKTIQYWSKISGLEFSVLKERLQWDDANKAFERGQLSEEGYAQHLAQQLGFELSYEEFFIGWNEIYLENIPGIEILLKGLAKDYKIATLSNTNLSHEKVWREKYKDLLPYFDQVLLSHHLGHVKPESGIYTSALEIMGVEASKAVFLDDKVENIEGAEQVGITGILMEAPSVVYRKLYEIGVLTEDLYQDLLKVL